MIFLITVSYFCFIFDDFGCLFYIIFLLIEKIMGHNIQIWETLAAAALIPIKNNGINHLNLKITK